MGVVVVDSVAALVPRAELEGEMGDAHMALQARLMSQALRKLTSSLSRSDTLLIFINQIRSKVGVLFGSNEVTTGGNALKFYSSVRLDIRRTGQLKQGDKLVGNSTRVRVVKNKMAPPFRTAEFDLMFGKGVSWEGELVDLGVQCGAVKKAGAWLSVEASIAPPEAWIQDEAEPEEDAADDGDDEAAGEQEKEAAAAEGAEGADTKKEDKKKEDKKEDKKKDKKKAPAPAPAPAAASYKPPEGSVMIGQGREKAKAWVLAHPAVSQHIAARVKDFMGVADGEDGEAEEEEQQEEVGGDPISRV